MIEQLTATPLPPLPPEDFIWFDPEHGDMPLAYSGVAIQAYARQSRADLEAEVQQWKSVFGHLGTADECGNEWIKLQDENQRLREAFDSLAERFSNMDANGDKWISTVAAAAMTLRALEKQQ